jgi:hypothetical protein
LQNQIETSISNSNRLRSGAVRHLIKASLNLKPTDQLHSAPGKGVGTEAALRACFCLTNRIEKAAALQFTSEHVRHAGTREDLNDNG